MDYEKLEKMVNEQLVASLGLVTPSGLPHNTPVWASYFEKFIYIFSRSGRNKAMFAKQNPNCMVAFKNGAVRGKIELLQRGTPEYEEVMDIPDTRYRENPNYEKYKRNWDIAFKISPSRLY